MKRITKKSPPKTYIILHDIRSAFNVGSVFRTGDAAGISKIFLCGYTPSPVDDFGRARKDIAKVALGAEKTVPWESHKNTAKLINELKKQKVKVIGIEQAPKAIHIKTLKIKNDTAFIFGNETKGLSKKVLSLCDEIVFIPMRGKKESLNVSVSVAVALYAVLDF